MTSSWLELGLPVEVSENIFVDAYPKALHDDLMMRRTHRSNFRHGLMEYTQSSNWEINSDCFFGGWVILEKVFWHQIRSFRFPKNRTHDLTLTRQLTWSQNQSNWPAWRSLPSLARCFPWRERRRVRVPCARGRSGDAANPSVQHFRFPFFVLEAHSRCLKSWRPQASFFSLSCNFIKMFLKSVAK